VANVLLVTSNGTGMGHLTRQAAIALSMGDEHKPTIFSLSLGLPLVVGLGIAGEYCPSYDRPWIATRNWNSYLRDRIVAIAKEIEADGVLFDGVAPYPGLAHAARELRHVAFIWLRRGMWKDTNQRALHKGRFFDAVIEPGDLAAEDDHGPTAHLEDAIRVGPISILEPLGPLAREEARRHLALPTEGPVALVTLGSGRLGDVAGPGRVAVETLLAETDWHVAVTRSPVAINQVPVEHARRLTKLSDVYPLARYLSAFDAAVSSAGYNAVHELIPAGVPTLLVANTSTRTDDQTTRAVSLGRQGLALAANDSDLTAVESGVRALLDEGLRSDLHVHGRETITSLTGASETAAAVVSEAEAFHYRRRSAREFAEVQVEKAKNLVRSMLGEERTEKLKRALGRRPTPVHSRSTVEVVSTTGGSFPDRLQLAFVRSLRGGDLHLNQPIEHVIEGASSEYEAQRLEIVHRYYDVVAQSSQGRGNARP
jgi:predicted glycosyltransferase